MKSVEVIKTIVLILLIALSLLLTFTIWTFTPNLKTVEQPPTVDISIADRVGIDAVIKPYKLLFNFEEDLRGTTDAAEIDHLIGNLENLTITDLSLKDQDFGTDKLDEFMRKPNSFILLFHAEVPLPVYDNILKIEESNIWETSFDRVVVEWDKTNTSTMIMHFISRENNSRYSARAHLIDPQKLHQLFLNVGSSYSRYVEVESSNETFLTVPTNRIELVKNTYYQDENSPSRFRDALFSDPNAVRRSQVDSNIEEFQDDYALMSVNTLNKTLDYVHPVAKSNELAIPSELLLDTFDFINEHGGWTDEFRFSRINPASRYVEFQLYIYGIPVFSDTTSTKIEQVWGDERIYRYKRPFYTLDLTFPSETEMQYLSSGQEVAELLAESNDVDINIVEEIIPGYFMKHDTNRNLFLLEPSWYYLVKGNWIRFAPEQLGGDLIGLE